MTILNKNQIRDLLPHREPMLLIDELYDIKAISQSLASAAKEEAKAKKKARKKK